MEAYLKLNWRTSNFSLLTSDQFISEASVNDSYVFKGLDHLIDVNIFNENVKSVENEYIPGMKYFKPISQRSVLNKGQQQECLHALLLMTNSKEKLNSYDSSTLEVYNRLRLQISQENMLYSKYVHDEWNKGKRTYMIPKALTTYAKETWKRNLQYVTQYPSNYKLFEAIAISYDPGESNAEMILKQNIFDLGHVAKYIGPVFQEQCLLREVVFPLYEESNLHFKNKVSEDRNIDQMVNKNHIDIVISSAGFKKLIEMHEVSSNYSIPVIVRRHNDKNVAFIDEPLRCPNANKLYINSKAYKDAIKKKFCSYKGFSYDFEGYTIKEEDSQAQKERKDKNIYDNVSYKIWTLRKACEENILLKSQQNDKEVNVLVRSKIDACELLNGGKLQAITILPKLEYQLSFGGTVCTKAELLNQWCSLIIRPQSTLYRVRIHSDTSEVIMIDTCNLQRVNHEAQTLYNLKPSNGLQVMYKIFHKLSNLKCGHYLLHHAVADGSFVSLLEETDLSAGNVYNLHEECKVEKFIVEVPNTHPWVAIDCNLLLPVHKKLNVMPGMFAGAPACKRKQNNKTKGGKFQRKGNLFQKQNKNKCKKSKRKTKNSTKSPQE